ncbi:fungal-specific transcription factor domain-containing protein [Geopyxis carbonaria]|nr:fungal-specific transcription factor domain-containing protein [Geopyxis carbonaria]
MTGRAALTDTPIYTAAADRRKPPYLHGSTHPHLPPSDIASPRDPSQGAPIASTLSLLTSNTILPRDDNDTTTDDTREMHTFRLPPTSKPAHNNGTPSQSPPTTTTHLSPPATTISSSSSPSSSTSSPSHSQSQSHPNPPAKTAARKPNVRRPVSCTKCRTRKSRCDRKLPCASCVRHGDGVLCSYGEYAAAARASREVVELRERLGTLERLVREQAIQPPPQSPPYESASQDTNGWDAVLGEMAYLRGSYAAPTEVPVAVVGDPFFATPPVESALAAMPAREEADALVARYMAVFGSLVHILHEPSFMVAYGRFWAAPGSVHAGWVALLYVVLSLGAFSLPASAAGATAVPRYHDAAMRCLVAGQFMAAPTLPSVQALVLLIYAKNLVSDGPTAWALLGLTTNLATTLGLHRDSGGAGNAVETEQRRRVWAAVQMLDALQGSVFGRPCLIRSATAAQTRMPADVNDADITAAGVGPPSSRPTQMTYLNCKFRLLAQTARIAELNFTPGCSARYRDVIALDGEIRREADGWPKCYGAAVQEQVHWWILHGHYRQMLLLLHRPYWRPEPQSRETCVEAAVEGVTVYRALQAPVFEAFRWYTDGLASFHAFHAAVVLGMALVEGIEVARDAWEEVVALLEVREAHSGIVKKAMGVVRALQRLVMPAPPSWPTPVLDDAALLQSCGADPALFYPATANDGGVLHDWLEGDVSHWLTPSSMEWVGVEICDGVV